MHVVQMVKGDLQVHKETMETQVHKEMLEMMVILDQPEIMVNLVVQGVQGFVDHKVLLDLMQAKVM